MRLLTHPLQITPFLLLLSAIGFASDPGRAAARRTSQNKCTTVIVGRQATFDGSVLLAHNEDWGEFETPLRWHPRARHQPGERLTLRGGLTLEQVEETHGYLVPAAICNGINEFQVMITDNSGSCRKEMVPGSSGIEMTDLVPLALQRARTAREAIQVMGRLIDRFGYRCIDGPGGDIFSVADPAEGWWMEVTTAGVWAAQRVPDDAFVVIANRFRIGAVDLSDPSRFMGSSNLVSYARSQGWHDPRLGPFHFAQAYSGERTESPKREKRGNTLLGGTVPNPDHPALAVVPGRKLRPSDLMNFLRDHYEDPAAEDRNLVDHGSPHRTHERTICTTYTDASTVAHLRGWLPPQVGGLLWLALGSPCSSAYTPVYLGVTGFPSPYSSVPEKYDSSNAYWTFNALESLVDRHYHERRAPINTDAAPDTPALIQIIRDHWRRFENEALRVQPAVEQTALELLRSDEHLARSFLTTYTHMMSLRALEEARSLADDIRTHHER